MISATHLLVNLRGWIRLNGVFIPFTQVNDLAKSLIFPFPQVGIVSNLLSSAKSSTLINKRYEKLLVHFPLKLEAVHR